MHSPRLAVANFGAPAHHTLLLLHFGVLHLRKGIGGFRLLLLQVLGPHVVHPVHQIYLQGQPSARVREPITPSPGPGGGLQKVALPQSAA